MEYTNINILNKWSIDQQEQLLQELKKKLTYEQISINHNRTLESITTRIKYISYKMYLKKIDIDKIIKKTHLQKQEILNYIDEMKNHEMKNHEKKINIITDMDLIEEFKNIKNTVSFYDSLTYFTDNIIKIDYIINVENQYIRKCKVERFVICEIPDIIEPIINDKNPIYLYTGLKEWIKLKNTNKYIVEVDNNNIKNVWIGELCSFNDIIKNTNINNDINTKGLDYFNYISTLSMPIDSIKLIHARCDNSMFLLDDIHRNYINSVDLKKNNIIAIKSVAGSGKTTTLLNLAKIHKSKKILYIAFNKNLINEIKSKISTQEINNLIPQTFDAVLYKLYTSLNGHPPDIFDLKPHTISKILPFFDGKPFTIKKYYIKHLFQFCNNPNYSDIKTYCTEVLKIRKPLLEQLWDKVISNELITFETMRKQSYLNHWCKDYIDKHYDAIMIDETQDFDLIMLNVLLNDTTIPKIFVGDPKQSIYQFRGCINAFNYLPDSSFVIEFYSTFRVGNPVCQKICDEFKDCWMISKSKYKTEFIDKFDKDEKYTYLFRSWRILLQTAATIENIWIYNHESKLKDIRNLHEKLINIKNFKTDANTFDDDLPNFLKSITTKELEILIHKIEHNIVSYQDSIVKFYTVHSYKGMENCNIRLAEDINIKEDENIYYVAITRGINKVLIDIPLNKIILKNYDKLQSKNLITTFEKKDNTIVLTKSKRILSPTISFMMFNNDKKSIEEIAEIRNLQTQTVLNHILMNLSQKDICYDRFMNENEYNEIKNAFNKYGLVQLRYIKNNINKNINYIKINVVRKILYDDEDDVNNDDDDISNKIIL